MSPLDVNDFVWGPSGKHVKDMTKEEVLEVLDYALAQLRGRERELERRTKVWTRSAR